MAGTEELLARLTQLENGYYGDKEAARQKQFFDTYGSRFSNNRGLGIAILNELDARGIDTSAADEAVQQILDQLRMECQEILDMTKDANQAAIDTTQHVEEVANAVSQAITNNPSAEPSDAMPPEVEPAEMPPEMMDAEEFDRLNALRARISDELEQFYTELSAGLDASNEMRQDVSSGQDFKQNPEQDVNQNGENNTGSEQDSETVITSRTKLDVRVISTALYRFMSAHRLQERMTLLASEMEEQGDPIRAKEFGRIYEEVCDLLDKMVRLLPGETITIEEYAELLDAGFAEIRTGIIPPSDDYVQIGDITRTRLRDIKALFFMGVNDGIIPSAAGSGGILSDMEREFLVSEESDKRSTIQAQTGMSDNDSNPGRDYDKDISIENTAENGEEKGRNEAAGDMAGRIELAPTARMQAYTQRLYLYMLLTKPSRELYISYAGLARDGKSLSPSYLVKTVKRMFPNIVTEFPDRGIMNRAYNLRTGYDELTEGIQDALRDCKDNGLKEYGSLLGAIAGNRDYKERIGLMFEAAFSEGGLKHHDMISRAVAQALYGTDLTCSVTRLENYARCAYAHFLKYGLGLKERELFSFEAKDLGSVFHDTLQTYAQILKERDLSWQDIDPADSEGIIDESIERCIAREDYGAIYGSFRTRYMINRIRRIMRRTVDTLTAQLKKGQFEPYDFEFTFQAGNDYRSLNVELTDEEKVRLIGRIDRVDICVPEGHEVCEDNEAVEENNEVPGDNETAAESDREALTDENTKTGNGKIYVKVIDYKSGNKNFDLAAVYMGLELQLVVYMNAACEYVKRQFKDKEPVPAGILYYHIDDPLISTSDEKISDEKIRDEISKQLKMNGLINSDECIYRLMDSEFVTRSEIIPVSIKKDGGFGQGSSVADTGEFKVLSDYVSLKIKETGQAILNGNIRPEPHMKSESDTSPCAYCDYYGVCGYRGRVNTFDADRLYDASEDHEIDYGGTAGGGESDDTDAAENIIRAMEKYNGIHS